MPPDVPVVSPIPPWGTGKGLLRCVWRTWPLALTSPPLGTSPGAMGGKTGEHTISPAVSWPMATISVHREPGKVGVLPPPAGASGGRTCATRPTGWSTSSRLNSQMRRRGMRRLLFRTVVGNEELRVLALAHGLKGGNRVQATDGKGLRGRPSNRVTGRGRRRSDDLIANGAALHTHHRHGGNDARRLIDRGGQGHRGRGDQQRLFGKGALRRGDVRTLGIHQRGKQTKEECREEETQHVLSSRRVYPPSSLRNRKGGAWKSTSAGRHGTMR